MVGRVMAAAAGIASPSNGQQEIYLLLLGPDGPAAPHQIAIIYHHYAHPSDRLGAAALRSSARVSLNVAPIATCPATLRAFVAPERRDPKSGAVTHRVNVIFPRGFSSASVTSHLDDAPSCYELVATPGARQ